jgi:ribose transport system substrate-binding protein
LKRTRALAAAAAALMTAAVLAGCSSGDSSSGGSTGASASTTDSAFMDELAAGYEGSVPTQGPAPAKGKSVWWISCGESVPDCSEPAASAKEAAEKLGLDFHIADGKLNEGGGNAAAVRTALAANPAAIITHGFSCAQAQQALQEANDQGVLVMSVEGMDCNEAGGDGPQLYNTTMLYSDKAKTVTDYFDSWGVLAGKYAAGASGGTAQIINNAGVEPLMVVVDAAFQRTLKEDCAGCSIVDTVSFGSSDYGPSGPWIQQFRSALAKNPQATATFLGFDANLSFSGGPQAIAQSGLDLISFGGTGGSVGMDLVRSGELGAVTGAHDVKWMGYAAMDNINRALQGQPTVPQGVGAVVVDKDHNLPATEGTGFQSKTDWKAAYDKLWGVSG